MNNKVQPLTLNEGFKYMYDPELCITITIIPEHFQQLPSDVQEQLNDFDLISNIEYNGNSYTMFEDIHVIYPKEHYNPLIEHLKTLPEESYRIIIELFENDDNPDIIFNHGLLDIDEDSDTFIIIDKSYN